MKTKFLFLPTLLAAFACSGSPVVADKTLNLSASSNFVDYVTNSEGTIINLSKAKISWAHIHLMPGGESLDCDATTLNEIDIDAIQDLLTSSTDVFSLTEAPVTDQAYCNYVVHLEPIETTDSEMTGLTVLLEGGYIFSGDDVNYPFTVQISDEIEIEGSFQAGQHVHFDDGQDLVSIVFLNSISTWFDGVDFSGTQAQIAETIRNNISESLSQITE